MRVPSRRRWPDPARRSTRAQSTMDARPKRLAIASRVHPLRQTQAHHQRFVRCLDWAQRRLFHNSVAIARQRRQVILWLAMAQGSHAGAPPMRAGPDTGIIAISPIGEIVPAFFAGARVVADFVVRHAGGRGDGLGQFVELGRAVEVERMESGAWRRRSRTRARFDRQLVEREMGGAERRWRGRAWPPSAPRRRLAKHR